MQSYTVIVHTMMQRFENIIIIPDNKIMVELTKHKMQ